VVGSAAHAHRRATAVHHRRHSAARRVAGAARLRAFDRRRGGGGLLISISDPLPFLAAAAIVAACMAAFAATGVRHRRGESSRGEADIVAVAVRIVDLIRCQRELQAFLIANALWELALAALKTFVVLYVTKTLGFSLAGSSGVIAAAALIVLVGAVVSGPLGDRYGRARVMRCLLALYGLGLLVHSRRRPPRRCSSPSRSSPWAAE
jgi:MFS transporter